MENTDCKEKSGIREELMQSEEFEQFINSSGEDGEFLVDGVEMLINGYSGKKQESKGSGITRIPLEHLKLSVKLSAYKSKEKKNEILQKLYRLGAAHSISKIQKIFQQPEMRRLFFKLRMTDLNDDKTEILKEIESLMRNAGEKEFTETVDELFSWIEILRSFTTDKAVSSKDEDQRPPVPFDSINTNDEEWEKLIDISSNFGHALQSVFNTGVVFMYLQGHQYLTNEDLDDEDNPFANSPRYLHYQAKALKGFLQLLEGYKRELLESDETEKINNWHPVLYDVCQMLNSRSFSVDDDLAPLPVRIPGENSKENHIVLNNADKYKLTRALLEIGKNAFDEGKADTETLKKMRLTNEPYLSIVIRDMRDRKGNDMLCISYEDKGESINKDDLESLARKKVKNREDLIGILAERGMSTPVGDADASVKHNGLGLAEARAIIREHNGDIFCDNRKEGGVCFYVLLPKEGKKSPHRLRIKGNNVDVLNNDDVGYVKRITRERFGVIFSD